MLLTLISRDLKIFEVSKQRLSEGVASREGTNEKVSDTQRIKCLLICQLQKSWNSAMWDCECGISVTWSAKKCEVCHDWTLTVILMFELHESQKIGSRFLHSRPCPEKGAPNQVSFSIFCKWIRFNVLAGKRQSKPLNTATLPRRRARREFFWPSLFEEQ